MAKNEDGSNWDQNDSPKEQAERKIFQMPGTSQRAEDKGKAMKEVGPYLTLGFQLAMFVVFGVALGWYLDKDSGSSFWTGMLAAAGAVAGLVYFLTSVLKLEKKSEKK